MRIGNNKVSRRSRDDYFNNPSKLLNLWDDKKFLENMPPKQRREAEATRIELGRLLGEASAVRSVFNKSNAAAKQSMDATIADAKKECSFNGRWGMKGEKNHGVTRKTMQMRLKLFPISSSLRAKQRNRS